MSSLFVACLNQHTALRFRARKLLIPPESKRINNFIIHHRLDRFFSSSTPMLQSPSQKDNTVRTSITSHQQAIISSSLSNVHEYGWTQDAISQAVLKLKLPLSMSSLLQPKDLISHFMHDSNARLKTFLSQPEFVKDQGSFDVYNKIERAIKYRLELVIPYVQSNTWHEAMAIGACQNTNETANQLEDLISTIVNQVTNSASSPNLGSIERMSLGGIYAATELHLLTDTSPGYMNTWIFLSSRMNEFKSLSMANQNGTIPPLSALPDKNFIIGASAVATSLGTAILSLAVPGIKSAVDSTSSVIGNVIEKNASSGLTLVNNIVSASSTQQTIRDDGGRSKFTTIANPTGNASGKNQINYSKEEEELLKNLPPFEKDVGFPKSK